MKNKYDGMVAVNQAISREKTRQALQAIQQMVRENAEITVKELQERTGLSRAFFYKNEKVKSALEKARKQSDQVDVYKRQGRGAAGAGGFPGGSGGAVCPGG